jgi:hypothetical protein
VIFLAAGTWLVELLNTDGRIAHCSLSVAASMELGLILVELIFYI